MYFHNLLRIFILILILAGCEKKRPVKLQFIDQARLVDIPIPPSVNPINLNHKANSNINNHSENITSDNNNSASKVISLKFNSKLSFSWLKKFYLEQMELADWQLAWTAPAQQQTSFIFQKPNRVCNIVIENLDQDFSGTSNKTNLGCEVRLISGPL